MQGVVLVAGEGTRLRPLTFTVPKPLVPVLGRPLIEHILLALRNAGVRDITLVVGYLGNLFRERLGDGSHLDISIQYVVQEKRLGIAHAIYRAIEEGAVNKPFVVHLGDNFFEEGVERFAREFLEGGYDVFIVLTKVKDPSRFGYVMLRDRRPWKLIEKPRNPPPGGYTLTGFYAFRDPDLVVRGFRDLKPSTRGEYEITDLIQWFIDKGYDVGYAITNGWWKDMGTPQDLLDLVYLLLDKIETRIEGSVEGEVHGRVVVEKGAVVEGSIYGPAYIGRSTYITKEAIIEHFVDVEQGSRIVGGSLSRCLVLEEVNLILGRARLVDSIVGPKSWIELGEGVYSLVVGEKNLVKKI
ncbi:MAG TPA: glucose-1-phosphate thymidylyltransferase [Pyrodictium sp.]|nr:glucose-1-phosphate thymidylyltransferase [Pyrodictium sp.]